MIETPRLRLRGWQGSDLPALHAILGDPEVMAFSEDGALTQAAQELWLAQASQDTDSAVGDLCLAVTRRGGAVIGYVSLRRDHARVGKDDVELGIRLARSSWGLGLAREALGAVIRDPALRRSAKQLVAHIDPNNLRSLALFRALDFAFDGTFMLPAYDYPDHRYVRAV